MADQVQRTMWHSHQLVEAVRVAVSHLIPGAATRCVIRDASAVTWKDGFRRRGAAGQAGGTYSADRFKLRFTLSPTRVCIIEVYRDSMPLTKTEMRVLGRLPDTLAGLLISPSTRGLELAQKICARLSLEHLLLAKFLRDGRASTYWTPAHVLLQLQELTFRRYEGKPCTSGFVYMSQPGQYIPRVAESTYELVAFPRLVRLTGHHFQKPASFRYVDGRNSFYLIDNLQRVHGLLTAKAPERYDIVDRCSHEHIAPLVERMPGRVWAAYVGMNDDVNVHLSGGIHFRWIRNHWHLIDKSILSSILHDHGCDRTLLEALCRSIYALSELRLGAVLLLLRTL